MDIKPVNIDHLHSGWRPIDESLRSLSLSCSSICVIMCQFLNKLPLSIHFFLIEMF